MTQLELEGVKMLGAAGLPFSKKYHGRRLSKLVSFIAVEGKQNVAIKTSLNINIPPGGRKYFERCIRLGAARDDGMTRYIWAGVPKPEREREGRFLWM